MSSGERPQLAPPPDLRPAAGGENRGAMSASGSGSEAAMGPNAGAALALAQRSAQQQGDARSAAGSSHTGSGLNASFVHVGSEQGGKKAVGLSAGLGSQGSGLSGGSGAMVVSGLSGLPFSGGLRTLDSERSDSYVQLRSGAEGTTSVDAAEDVGE